ncbi:uncharacterized protein LOC124841437 isoform X1 [Vigna umbellata]|uniref:uncharacterized protein LOC124841437 isoform X1 n=1 Tax=Vigna umbellata TaxID=87088 RepID=UPI001F5FB87E|nr:uncharacterized protein LOC124841437 isoform X1 [Vigna umbellata]
MTTMAELTTTKPSRSDEILDTEEQLRIAYEIKAHFDALQPDRPVKPNRSEPGSPRAVNHSLSKNDIPELHKFQSLQSSSHDTISTEGVVNAQDEFVETQYYNELASIDKQHHTTGSGFINVVTEGEESGYKIELPDGHVNAVETEIQPRGYKSNPATNDWVPSSDDYQVFVSSKPSRSECS